MYLKNIDVISCEELASEISDVLKRPKLKKVVPQQIADKIMQLHSELTTSYKLDNIPLIVSDIKDNYLFALCDIAEVDYFVTGDKLLFSKNPYNKTEIISLNTFKNIIIATN